MKRKYKLLIITAAIGSIALTGAAALTSLLQSGTLLYREYSSEYEVSVKSESGAYLNAWIDRNAEHRLLTSESDLPKAEYTVNINTATLEELADMLPGIGEKKAAAIIEYREQTGGFRSVEELIEVEGISFRLLEQLRPYCVTGDEMSG